MIIPGLKDWFEGTFGASLQHKTPATVSAIHVYSLCLSVNGKEESELPNHNGLFCFSPFWPAVLYRLPILMRPLWRNWNPQVSPCLMMQKTGCFVDMVRHSGRRTPPPTEPSIFSLPKQGFYFCFFFLLHFLPGHCVHEIFALREGKVGRVPDMVVWPSECISCVIAMFLLVCFSPPT